MTRPIKGLWLFLLSFLGLGLYGSTACAATTAVLCNSDIKGDSQVDGAADCIDVLAWSWGLSAAADYTIGSNPHVSVPTLRGFNITKFTDSSSDDLFRMMGTQKLLTGSNGILEFREYNESCGGGCTAQPYVTIHMRNVFVTSLSMSGSDGDDRNVESVSFEFDEVSYCFWKASKSQCFAYSQAKGGAITPF